MSQKTFRKVWIQPSLFDVVNSPSNNVNSVVVLAPKTNQHKVQHNISTFKQETEAKRVYSHQLEVASSKLKDIKSNLLTIKYQLSQWQKYQE